MGLIFMPKALTTSTKLRVYAALVKSASRLSVAELKTKARAAMGLNNRSDVFLSSYLDALRTKVTADEFSDFMTTF